MKPRVSSIRAPRRSLAAGVVAALVLVVQIGRVDAACNAIPGAANSFQSARGTTDRPFARPGDVVRVSLDSFCDGSATSLFGPTSADDVVTVAFQPVQGGAAHLVVIAKNCGAISACPLAASTTCVPSTPVTGPAALVVTASRHLEFRFPDTDALLPPDSDLVTLTGPAAIAVTRAGNPLPCALATAACKDVTGTIACVDAFFADDGTCGGTKHGVFPHFTALPPANDFQALCSSPSPPCTGQTDSVQFTVDSAGNILLPMSWRGVLVPSEVPVGRLLRGESPLNAFAGRGEPVRLPIRPEAPVATSFSLGGVRLLPIFDPHVDPDDQQLILFGSADDKEAVLRITRHDPRNPSLACAGGTNDGRPCLNGSHCPGGSCSAPQCVGGSNVGLACATDTDCPGSECGPGFFEFRDRLIAGIGPVFVGKGQCVGGTIPLDTCSDDTNCPGGECGDFSAQAQDPVPLDGLNQSAELNAFVVPEGIADADLNGDGDELDDVVKLTRRDTGEVQSIGDTADAVAVVRVHEPPFSYPAVAVDGDVLAMIESESGEGYTDENGNGRHVDPILRVFRLGVGEVGPQRPNRLAADPAPAIDDRPLRISNDLVFFRTPEDVAAGYVSHWVPYYDSFAGGDLESVTAMSGDGRFLAFFRQPWSGGAHAYVVELATGTIERADVPSGTSGDSVGDSSPWPDQGNSYLRPALSWDGRFVAFVSAASDLVPGDTNGARDVFVRDRLLRVTERVSVSSSEAEATGSPYWIVGPTPLVLAGSGQPAISADGSIVAFTSWATNLVPNDTNGRADVFVRDRAAGMTQRVSVATDGSEAAFQPISNPPGSTNRYNNLGSQDPAISANGSVIAFDSHAINLVSGDSNSPADTFSGSSGADVFVHERASGRTEIADLSNRGEQPPFGATMTGLSSNGRFVVFEAAPRGFEIGTSQSSTEPEVFVRDREKNTTQWVSASLTGRPGAMTVTSMGNSLAAISTDGRIVTFLSAGGGLVPGFDQTGRDTIYRRDLVAGVTEVVSGGSAGGYSSGASGLHSMSGDGSSVGFVSYSENIDPAHQNRGFYVRFPDTTNGATDLFPDGDRDDVVLQVLDVASGAVTTLCPARQVAVSNGRAAFLRPEAATGGSMQCPPGSLNPDGDTSDQVVQFWDGSSSVENLGRAATRVALSANWVAALVSEAGDNQSYNSDGDRSDVVLQVHAVSGGAWLPPAPHAQAADRLAIAGNMVAFTTPEGAEGRGSLNGDPDTDDDVIQAYFANSDTQVPLGRAVEDFVLGPSGILAFRTSEAAQGQGSLNGDGDTDDDVLQIYDPASGVISTGQAVTPCRLEACDPRMPYRVLDHTVRFLTFECDQGGPETNGCLTGGTDLNGDGDAGDLVVQVINLAQSVSNTVAQSATNTAVRSAAPMGSDVAIHAIAAIPTGVCTDSGAACVRENDCGGTGSCIAPQAGCVIEQGACNPTMPNPCVTGAICQPTLGMPSSGTCEYVVGPCATQYDCATGTCNVNGLTLNRLSNPFGIAESSDIAVTGVGRCVEDFGTPCTGNAQCGTGEYCADGTCRRDSDSCRTTEDCPIGATCQPDLVREVLADRDLDEVLDRFDNCPDVWNPRQEDRDCDGPGDSSGGCPALPSTGCRQLGADGSSDLYLKSVGQSHKLTWRWRSRTAATKADFGHPPDSTTLALCVYEEDGGTQTLLSARAPAGGSCKGPPCWKEATSGFGYSDRDRTPDGIYKLKLKASATGADISLLALGPNLSAPPLPLQATPAVRAQLISNDSGCWEVSYPDVLSNTASRFRARVR